MEVTKSVSVITKKSEATNKQKRVTWSPVEVEELQLIYHDEIPKQDLWYTPQDLCEIRLANELAACSVNSSVVILPHDSEDHETGRGLESMTEEGEWERYQQLRDCLNKVLDEQDRQKGIDKNEVQNTAYPLVKRANHMHVAFDHERLAGVSRHITANARKVAKQRAQADFAAIQADYNALVSCEMKKTDTREDHIPLPSPSTSAFFASSPPTDILSSAVSEGKGHVPIQVVNSYLERLENRRFEQYLKKREERMIAAAAAAFEMQRMKLRRAEAIRAEADENILVLNRIMSLSQEMSNLIKTCRV